MTSPFQTPTNEKSFSALIDNVILASGKPQSLISIVGFANATIRECQALGLFARDMIEDSVVVPSDNTTSYYTWTRDTKTFRSLRTVKYLTAAVYPELILPGKKQDGRTWFYYAADDYFVFNGVAAGETIAFAKYYWAKRLAYYAQLGVTTTAFPGGPYATRPAYYDETLEAWQYLNTDGNAYVSTTGDTAVDTARQLAAMNWLISDWYDVILSGTKAKIFNSSSDPRSAAEYSLYKQLQTSMRNTVGLEGEGF